MINIKTRLVSFKKRLSLGFDFCVKYYFFKYLLSLNPYHRLRHYERFLDTDSTISFLKNSEKSIIRYGDGETYIIMGDSIYFQKYNDNLRNDLLKIIKEYNKNSRYLLGIPMKLLQMSNRELKKINKFQMWLPYKILFEIYYSKRMIYGDGRIFRDLAKSKDNRLDWIFKSKNLLLVTNKTIAKKAVKLIDSKNIHILIVKDKNAYEEKKRVITELNDILKKFRKEDIITLLSCGPLAKVLAYHISNKGYRALDLGHFFYFS